MSKLLELLRQHPEEEKEFKTMLDCLNNLHNNLMEVEMEYGRKLEDMIIDKVDREEMLMYIDMRNCYSAQMHVDGTLDEDIMWWELQ